MENRFKRAIESLHQAGACPRLQIDLTCDGVVCPDFVVAKWGERLVIDLDPSYPLNLAFTAIGVEADLSFGGYVTRCKFPYASIYMIADRATGQGTLFEENLPPSLRRERGLTLTPTEPAPRPVATRERNAGESRRRRRRPRGEGDETGDRESTAETTETAEPAPPVAGAAAVEAKTSDGTEGRGEAPVTPAEEKARAVDRRRAMFKVIDGGK